MMDPDSINLYLYRNFSDNRETDGDIGDSCSVKEKAGPFLTLPLIFFDLLFGNNRIEGPKGKPILPKR
jgi:hypothetical protein